MYLNLDFFLNKIPQTTFLVIGIDANNFECFVNTLYKWDTKYQTNMIHCASTDHHNITMSLLISVIFLVTSSQTKITSQKTNKILFEIRSDFISSKSQAYLQIDLQVIINTSSTVSSIITSKKKPFIHMNRAIQVQLSNLQSYKKDIKPRAFGPLNLQSKPLTEFVQVLTQDLRVFESLSLTNQHFTMELLKFDFNAQPLFSHFHLSEDLIIPKAGNNFNTSHLIQRMRIKGMKEEDVKKEFFNSQGECHTCGTRMSRNQKNHTLSHFKTDNSMRDTKTRVGYKTFSQRLVNKAQTSNLVKRTFDELSDDISEELEKKCKEDMLDFAFHTKN